MINRKIEWLNDFLMDRGYPQNELTNEDTVLISDKFTDDTVVINDKALRQCIEDDLQENYNYTIDEASKWLSEGNGDGIASDMWDAYTNYFEQNVPYKEGEDE